MNNSNKTTRELAIEYFDDLSHKDRKGLSWKHFNRLDWHHLTDEQIEGIYNWEHPPTEQPKPEVLEGNKGAKWYLLPASFKPLRGFNEIVIAEMDIDFTNELAKENKELKNRIDYVEKVSFESAKDYALLKEANERMKEALQEVAEFLHVLPMLRLGDKEGFDKCVNIDGVKELESKAKEALQANPNK